MLNDIFFFTVAILRWQEELGPLCINRIEERENLTYFNLNIIYTGCFKKHLLYDYIQKISSNQKVMK